MLQLLSNASFALSCPQLWTLSCFTMGQCKPALMLSMVCKKIQLPGCAVQGDNVQVQSVEPGLQCGPQ